MGWGGGAGGGENESGGEGGDGGGVGLVDTEADCCENWVGGDLVEGCDVGSKAVMCNGKYEEGGGEIGDGFVGEISFTGGLADWEDVVGGGINEGEGGD